ncbi:EscD/YscD/HrpQ family type III secretion system periplasmic domain-containing protein [Acetobacter sp. P1H12_c]|uniref:SctD/MshK family protein n=1 Tax=Acetobacter sp. P1H12_c TaxID=2762621 RepID=UPI001C040749|nr:EscD/YscD/HrpQ family type III secretion system periplasmic domain-containing protein [Acetobacter sp. P1H12_c]
MSDLPARKQNMALSDHDLGESVIHELRNHDLFGLAVRVSGGVVTVSGAVPHERLTAFRDAEQWFDASYGQQYTWISDVKESSNKVLSLPIQSIWLGQRANVTIKGQRYYIGSILESGQKITDISDHKVSVLDGHDEFLVTY